MGPPLSGCERVLVRLPAWLGDFVACEPLLRALSQRCGAQRLTLVGRGAHLGLLGPALAAARRVELDEDARDAWRGHDVALLCSGSFRSAWDAFRARIPRRVGYARDGRGPLLTDALAPALERGATPLGLGRAGRRPRFLPRPLERSMLDLGGLLGLALSDPTPRLEAPREARDAARARRAAAGLDPAAGFLLACVGGRPGSSKAVPAELWARILSPLARLRDVPVPVLTAAPGEEESLAAVRAALGACELPTLQGAPLWPRELAAQCAEARLVLCGDSGPRHLARALARPAVIVTGPTDPRHSGEGPRERVVRERVPCGPCHRERCPLAGDARLRCMHAIEPEAVLGAVRALLHDGA